MTSLSGLLARLHRHPLWGEAMRAGRDNPALAGGALASEIAPHLGSWGLNLGALYACWWRAPRRVVWTVAPETAALVAETGMAFVPPEPPPSWGGGAIIIEGQDGAPLVDQVFSLGCYRLATQGHYVDSQERYWLVALTLDGGAWTQSVRCDQGALNARLAQDPGFCDLATVSPHEADPWAREAVQLTTEERARTLRALQWVFAFSFFAARAGDWWRSDPAGDGPPVRDARGKVSHQGGRPVALWSYRRLVIASDPPADGGGDPRGPLDTRSLELRPTVVRAHWRRVGPQGEPRLIGSYASRRWRRTLGDVVRV